jgi:hypothetical protein
VWCVGRLEPALANRASEADAPGSPAAADAALTAGRVLVSLGDPLLALESFSARAIAGRRRRPRRRRSRAR